MVPVQYLEDSKRVRLSEEAASSTKIVGGDIAKYGEFPYFVSIQRIVKVRIFTGLQHFCGGGIVSKDVILTAAHCCYKKDFGSSKYCISAGIIKLNDINPKTIGVTNCIIHPDYNDNLTDNDIAVLFLKSSINFSNSPNIRPISYSSKPIEKDQQCSIMGFGAIDVSGKTLPIELRTLKQTVHSANVCELYFNNFNPHSMFCAGAVIGQDTCVGDSGSPFVCSGEIYGVVSYGQKKCGLGGPTMYANVPNYNGWIKNIIAMKSGKSNLYFTLYPYYILIFIIKYWPT
ncbi:serine protease 1-like [Lycorma delicatula]|uniref:serine protease 1-like n=1 Tax=Lycorma delicatula TaxID=130591 RepID=UPI003F51617A